MRLVASAEWLWFSVGENGCEWTINTPLTKCLCLKKLMLTKKPTKTKSSIVAVLWLNVNFAWAFIVCIVGFFIDAAKVHKLDYDKVTFFITIYRYFLGCDLEIHDTSWIAAITIWLIFFSGSINFATKQIYFLTDFLIHFVIKYYLCTLNIHFRSLFRMWQ